MRLPRQLRFVRPTRQHALPGGLLLVATVVTVVGWQQTSSAVSGLLDRLLDWAALVGGRGWPLLAAAALITLTSPQGRARLRRIPQARRVAAITGGLTAGIVWWAAWPATGGWLVAAGLVVVVGLLGAWVLVVPGRLAPAPRPEELADLSDRERLELVDARVKLRNDIRTTALQAIAGLAVLAGAVLAFQQLAEDRQQATTDRQDALAELELTRRGQVSERFTRAIDQLGSDRTETRIGGIYGLEQIAQQEPDHRLAVTEVLVAYLRRRASLAANSPPGAPSASTPATPDVQAALTVLGRRHVEPTDPPLDLSGLNLGGTDLVDADLSRANLSRANLHGADLHSADLHSADLHSADLSDAYLVADLRGANLHGANLHGAYVDNADLTGAFVDASTTWPDGFDWRAAGVELPPPATYEP